VFFLALLLPLGLLAQSASDCSGSCSKEINIKGSCNANDVIAAAVMVTGKGEGENQGLSVKDALSAGIAYNAEVIDAEHATSLELIVTRIKAVTGELYLQGYASVSGAIHYKTDSALSFPDVGSGEDETSTAFLEVSSGIPGAEAQAEREARAKRNAVKGDGVHWMQITSESFDEGAVYGWEQTAVSNRPTTTTAPTLTDAVGTKNLRERGKSSVTAAADRENSPLTTHCGDGNFFIGGHCVEAAGGGNALRKLYKGLRAHSQIRISARFHFIDQWNGEAAYAMVDNQIVWLDTHRSSSSNLLNVCGGPLFGSRLGSVVEVVVPHTGENLELSFGAMLQGTDPCDKSFGVDDIVIELR